MPSPLASWYRRTELNAAAERAVADAVLASDVEVLPHPSSHVPGDPAALRGVPILVRGVGSTIRGTQPERELLRRQRE